MGLTSNQTKESDTMSSNTIIYAFDPLCGWCYGFSPVIDRFSDEQPEIQIKVVPGGMITGDRIGPIGEVAPYIAWAYKDVEKATGIKFGEKFLDGTMKDGKAIFTSIPLSKAMAVVNRKHTDKALEAGSLLHKAVYYHGMKPMEDETYLWLAEELGLDGKEFLAEMEKVENIKRMDEDFQFSNELGVSGFPSLFLTDGERYVKFGEGYMPMDTLVSRYKAAVEMLGE